MFVSSSLRRFVKGYRTPGLVCVLCSTKGGMIDLIWPLLRYPRKHTSVKNKGHLSPKDFESEKETLIDELKYKRYDTERGSIGQGL